MSLALQFAAEDSTGQKITLIVIGLLLAALALAFLTVWYYRVTDPGPSHRKSARNGPAGPGSGSTRVPNSSSWKDRLSDFSLPTIPVRSSKPAGQPRPPKGQGTSPVAKPKTKARNPAAAPPPPAPAQARSPEASKPAPKQAAVPGSTPETVSLEGGFYLDLTEVSESSAPPTNVGSLNTLDLRQPAPLLDPDRAPVPDSVSPPVSARTSAPAANDGSVSFDDWLAEVEATNDQ